MMVLGIDTSIGVIDLTAVAAKEDRVELLAKEKRTSKSWPFHLENELSCALASLFDNLTSSPDLVAINLGPGSYTSLRSGLAFLKGWYLSKKEKIGKEPFKLIGLNGLEALEEFSGQKALQEERNKRYWRISPSTRKTELVEKNAIASNKDVLIRKSSSEDPYILIHGKKYGMSEIVARVAIKRYTNYAKIPVTKLIPIYAEKI